MRVWIFIVACLAVAVDGRTLGRTASRAPGTKGMTTKAIPQRWQMWSEPQAANAKAAATTKNAKGKSGSKKKKGDEDAKHLFDSLPDRWMFLAM